MASVEYLGSIFQADGDQLPDIRRRVAMAIARAGKLHNIWAAPNLTLKLKLQLYKSACCSILTYGSEAWMHTQHRSVQNHQWGKCKYAITHHWPFTPRRGFSGHDDLQSYKMDQGAQVKMGRSYTPYGRQPSDKKGTTLHLQPPTNRRHFNGHGRG